MAASIIKLKRSSVPNRVPQLTDLEWGELALNTYDAAIYTKINDGSEDGDQIVDLTLGSYARIQTYEFTATEGQTTFTIAGGYKVGSLTAFYNGVLLLQRQFSATNRSTITLDFPAQEGDQITILKPVNIVVDQLEKESEINDELISEEFTWSSQKISEMISFGTDGGTY
jgi:hypothetical protein